MKLVLLLLTTVLYIIQVSGQVKFGQLCSGNPGNTIRGCQPKYGCGNYEQRLGKRKHLGVDVVCSDGATVYAPFDVKIIKKAAPYGKSKSVINDGVELQGEGLCFHLFYVNPVKYSGLLKKGEKLGTMVPMQKVFKGITSHVHVQMCNPKINPTQYFSTIAGTSKSIIKPTAVSPAPIKKNTK